MHLNNLSPAEGSTKAKKRVGRGIGSGSGKTCGSGHKGQKSRSGGTVRPGFEGGQMPLQMRLPKYGFSSRVGRVTAEVRSAELNKVEGETVNLESLRKAGLINTSIKRVKIMLSGEITRKLNVEGMRVSKGAKAAIEKAGGSVAEFVEEKPTRLTKKAAPASSGAVAE
ncbi:MAG TPA: 50S ribosomal protein L15 [Gammaproteobacteria bacterium]|nr:50S ribosomal protein L15 [Gammaproteobacteria bacterium]|tara:strand:+ start:7734 stop:8237 length:504 start_codon:yes stop_codon:yes gene_type:complete